jgi:hypothetical protein
LELLDGKTWRYWMRKVGAFGWKFFEILDEKSGAFGWENFEILDEKSWSFWMVKVSGVGSEG